MVGRESDSLKSSLTDRITVERRNYYFEFEAVKKSHNTATPIDLTILAYPADGYSQSKFSYSYENPNL